MGDKKQELKRGQRWSATLEQLVVSVACEFHQNEHIEGASEAGNAAENDCPGRHQILLGRLNLNIAFRLRRPHPVWNHEDHVSVLGSSLYTSLRTPQTDLRA
jgi:hypothetical protein